MCYNKKLSSSYSYTKSLVMHLHPTVWRQLPAVDFACTNRWISLLDCGRSPLQSHLFAFVERTQNIWTDMPRFDSLL